MAPTSDHPAEQHQTPRDADAADAPSRAVVVLEAEARPVVRRAWPASVAELRARLPELARHPAVVATASATATAGTGLAVRALRHALRGGSAPAPAPVAVPVALTVHLVQRTHVVHHVVHHVARLPQP